MCNIAGKQNFQNLFYLEKAFFNSVTIPYLQTALWTKFALSLSNVNSNITISQC